MAATLTAPAEVIDLPAAIEIDGFGMAHCTACGADIWESDHWTPALADLAVSDHLDDPDTPRTCGA